MQVSNSREQALRRGELLGGGVPQATGQVHVLLGVRGRQVHVRGRPAQHAQAVDQPAQELIGGGEALPFFRRQQAQGGQALQGLAQEGGAQLGVPPAVAHLQQQDDPLQVAQGPGAGLGIQLTGARAGLHLPLPGLAQLARIQRLAGVQQLVADPLQARAQFAAAGDGPQARQGQPFQGVRLPLGPVVPAEGIQAAGRRPGGPVGTQAQVDLKDALFFGQDGGGGFPHQRLEELGVAHRRLASPLALPLVAVDEQQLDIRGVAQLPAAQFAQPQHGVLRGQPGHRPGPAVAGDQVLPGEAHGGLHHRLGQPGQPARELLEIRQRVKDVFQLQAEDLPVLELVKGPALLRQGAGPLDSLPQQARQAVRGRAQAPGVRLQHGQQGLVLKADEILPQEVAGPQQAGQLLQHARVGKQLQPTPLLRLDGLHQVLETVQGGVGVGGPAQEIGELLGQQHRQLDLVEHRWVGDAPAAGVEEGKLVLDAVVHGADADVVDEDRTQGQGGAQGVEEKRGVLGNHPQQGPPVLPRADGNLRGVQDRLHVQRQAGEVNGGQLVHPLAGLGQALPAALLQQEHRVAEQAAQAGLPQLQRLALGQAPGEVVDDPPAAQAGVQPGGQARCAGGPAGRAPRNLLGLAADIPVGLRADILSGFAPTSLSGCAQVNTSPERMLKPVAPRMPVMIENSPG